MSFELEAKLQQSKFRMTLSAEAAQPTDDKGKRNGHLIALGHEIQNLYPSLRGDDGALPFFRDRKIKWWTNARSGDRPLDEEFLGPTRNMASSQVACVNYLLPLAKIPEAVTHFLRAINDDVEGVVPIVDQGKRKSPVEFEWGGWKTPLEPVSLTPRGAHQTSVDAAAVAKIPGGKRAYLLEWKHTEKYLRPKYKGSGSQGATRKERYWSLFESPESPFTSEAEFDWFLEEPFYQIMRQLLLGQNILREGFTPSIKLTEVKVVVVCPEGNTDYRKVSPNSRMAAAFPDLELVADAVRANLKDPGRFKIVAPERIVATLGRSQISGALDDWLSYHEARYGWSAI